MPVIDKEKKTEKRREEGRVKKQKKKYLQEILERKKVTKVTKGGRQFSFTSLLLLKDKEEKKISFSYKKGKKMLDAFRKSQREAQKKLISYFDDKIPYSIPFNITVEYKSTKIIFKSTPKGSGIKAGGIVSKIFKYLEIKNVSAKIIGSRNRLNVIRACFLALDTMTRKKYRY